MKKLALLPFLFLMLVACSAEDDIIMQETGNTELSSASAAKPFLTTNCFDSFSAYTNINTQGGIGNPVIEFFVNVQVAPSKKQYVLTLEVQQIADCEDLTTGYGMVSTFSAGNLYLYAQELPVATLSPAQLPAGCYRWRIVANAAPGNLTPCFSATPWYEAPLF